MPIVILKEYDIVFKHAWCTNHLTDDRKTTLCKRDATHWVHFGKGTVVGNQMLSRLNGRKYGLCVHCLNAALKENQNV